MELILIFITFIIINILIFVLYYLLYYRIRYSINFSFEYIRFKGFYEEMNILKKEISHRKIEVETDHVLNDKIKYAIKLLYDTVDPYLDEQLSQIESEFPKINAYKKLGEKNKKNITEEIFLHIFARNKQSEEFIKIIRAKLEMIYGIYIQFRRLLSGK